MSKKHNGHRHFGASGYSNFEITVIRQRVDAVVADGAVYCWREIYNRVDRDCLNCPRYDPETCKNVG